MKQHHRDHFSSRPFSSVRFHSLTSKVSHGCRFCRWLQHRMHAPSRLALIATSSTAVVMFIKAATAVTLATCAAMDDETALCLSDWMASVEGTI